MIQMEMLFKFHFPESGLTTEIEAIVLDPGRWKILESVPFAEADLGDILTGTQADDGIVSVTGRIPQTDYKTHRYVVAKHILENQVFADFLNHLPKGTKWENMMGGYLLLHVPLALDYDPTPDLDAAISRVPK